MQTKQKNSTGSYQTAGKKEIDQNLKLEKIPDRKENKKNDQKRKKITKTNETKKLVTKKQ